MNSKEPSFGWTLAFLGGVFALAGAAFVISTMPGEMFHVRYFATVLLIGCIAVIMRTAINLVMFERGKSVLAQVANKRVLLGDVAPVACPDMWTVEVDEQTQQPVCINHYTDGSTIGDPQTVTTNLALQQPPTGNSNAWSDGFCEQVAKDTKLYPRVLPAKMCEYLGASQRPV